MNETSARRRIHRLLLEVFVERFLGPDINGEMQTKFQFST